MFTCRGIWWEAGLLSKQYGSNRKKEVRGDSRLKWSNKGGEEHILRYGSGEETKGWVWPPGVPRLAIHGAGHSLWPARQVPSSAATVCWPQLFQVGQMCGI